MARKAARAGDTLAFVLRRIRRSLALRLIVTSAAPSAAVLLAGLWLLIRHTQRIAQTDPERAFQVLREGALTGTALSLSFAALSILLVSRRLLVKRARALEEVMGRAERGQFLVRAVVDGDDELGRLARSFNTMLARVTDMAVAVIEQKQQLQQMQRELELQEALQQTSAQLAERAGELELVLEVSQAVSGTLDLREQLAELGRRICNRLQVEEFTALLFDEESHQLVLEAFAGEVPASVLGLRLSPGEGVTGEAAARGETIYVSDVLSDARFIHYPGHPRSAGSFLAVPLRAKGRVVGVMNLSRPRVAAFSPLEIRLAEAVAAQAALAIANARLYAQTLDLSFTDPLTGAPNRRALHQRLDQEWTRAVRFGDELALLMVDLDNFKTINDTWGHAAGDEVLQSVAAALLRNVRRVDLVARYGGEEFCVLLPRATHAEALDVAEKLRRAVAQTPLPAQASSGGPARLTISLGVASYGPEVPDVQRLLELADEALYAAKRGGRDQVKGAA